MSSEDWTPHRRDRDGDGKASHSLLPQILTTALGEAFSGLLFWLLLAGVLLAAIATGLGVSLGTVATIAGGLAVVGLAIAGAMNS